MASSEQSTAATLARLLDEDSPVLRLAYVFQEHDHELYLVGGALRDALLGAAEGGDLDLATNATPEETLGLVRPLAENVWLQGMRFGTVGAEVQGVHLEITTFRTER